MLKPDAREMSGVDVSGYHDIVVKEFQRLVELHSQNLVVLERQRAVSGKQDDGQAGMPLECRLTKETLPSDVAQHKRTSLLTDAPRYSMKKAILSQSDEEGKRRRAFLCSTRHQFIHPSNHNHCSWSPLLIKSQSVPSHRVEWIGIQ